MWPNRRILDLIGIEHPILQAPMAGSSGVDLAVAVMEAGGLGSLPCAMLDAETARRQIAIVRQRSSQPINLNFFCHLPAAPDPERLRRWSDRLRPFADALGIVAAQEGGPSRKPFDEAMCALVEEVRPEVVSFHFGLPAEPLLERVKATGAVVLSSATTVAEAVWLERQGVDAIIAQGAEAGGHRGIFLGDLVAAQPGTFALVPQVVDAVSVPVVAAGGIADGRGIVAAMALGASGVQIGTAYLPCPESTISDVHRAALKEARDDSTVLTNVLTGRPARGIVNRVITAFGPIDPEAPAFPAVAGLLAPLRKAAEAHGSGDFSPLWAGQAVALGREIDAGTLTRQLAADGQAGLRAAMGATGEGAPATASR